MTLGLEQPASRNRPNSNVRVGAIPERMMSLLISWDVAVTFWGSVKFPRAGFAGRAVQESSGWPVEDRPRVGRGCARPVSGGCANCFVRRLARRFLSPRPD